MSKKINWLFVFLFAFVLMWTLSAQATFSIVAVDTVTKEVGIAAASCVEAGGIGEICHAEPGVGAIIVQGLFSYANLNKGKQYLKTGLTARKIINQLIKNDADAGIRQYGVVTLSDSNRSAAYSGADLDVYFGHKVGPNYAIQGNILSELVILDNLEKAFIETDGSLAVKLMAALQAGKQVGADRRCTKTSTLCACIKVAKVDDELSSIYLMLEVDHVEGDPIDALQDKFDIWQQSQTNVAANSEQHGIMPNLVGNYPNPFNPRTTICYDLPESCQLSLKIFNIRGQLVRTLIGNEQVAGMHSVVWDGRGQNGNIVSSGVYLCRLVVEDQFIETKKMILLQ